MESRTGPTLETLVARTAGRQPGRRLFHAGNGFLIWAVLSLGSIPEAVIAVLCGSLFALLVGADLLRLRFAPLNRLFFILFRHFASPREDNRLASSTWFMGGIALAVALLPRDFAAAGILVLALADPMANWFGRRYGVRSLGGGSVLGSTIFWLVSMAILWPASGSVQIALLAATVTTLVEAFLKRVDDNLVIPIAAGGILWLATGIIG